MIRTINNFCHSDYGINKNNFRIKRRNGFAWFGKAAIIAFILIAVTKVYAQSGGWDASNTNGITGYHDHGNGVIQLLNAVPASCMAAAVHETSDIYDPSTGVIFSKCYKVFFGCPGNDQIGADTKGDGMAFSFYKGAYNINNGLACGGGLGYMGASAKMITIEFDTWSSQGNSGFDGSYGGGASGNHDEISLHKNGDASDAGKIISADAGNLEDGLEHSVCISYDPIMDILSVMVDGNTLLSYDATGTGNELEIYFGAGGLNQSWSSGMFGATNPATVSNGANIATTIGTPLCPAGVEITSPSNGTSYRGCGESSINITATVNPPASDLVSYVEFFIDGISIGKVNTAANGSNYEIIWNSPANGSHAITAIAHYLSGTTSVSPIVNITVGEGIDQTSAVPVIDGTIDAIWNKYSTITLNQGYSGFPELTANYKIMHDAANLYLLIDVTDSDLWNDGGDIWDDDGVEVFIDIGNDKSGSYGTNDYQYSFRYNNTSIIEYKHNAVTGVTFSQGAKAGGYIMEIKFPWSDLGGTPAIGSYIGFDIKINDDDDGGARDHELAWNDGTFGAWNSPSLFGTLQFLNCHPCPTSDAGTTQNLCNVTLTTLAANTPTLPATGVWTLVSGPNTPDIAISDSPTSGVAGMIAGTYIFRWTVSNGICTPATSDVTINISAQPTANAGTIQNLCNATLTTLAANVPTLPATGVWTWVSGPNTPDITIPDTPNSTVTDLMPGTYVFRWAISDGSCSAVSEVTVVNSTQPLATSAGDDQPLLCLDNTVLSANVVAPGTTGKWEIVSGVATITDPADPTTKITNIPEGTVKLEWITSSGVCEPARDTVVITRNPETTIASAGADKNICGNTVELDAQLVSNGIGKWSSLNSSVSFENPNDPKTKVHGLTDGLNQIVWTVTGICGGPSTDVVDIMVGSSTISVMVKAAQDTLCAGTAVTISATVYGSTATSFNYTWASSDKSLNTSTANSSVVVSPVVPGWTNYTVSVADANGCSASSIGSDSVYAIDKQLLNVPNLITPNGDTKNDCLIIYDVNQFDIVPGSQLNLFNRWGQEVYKNSFYRNGDFCGSDLTDGTYYYYIKTSCDQREIKGWLQIISNEAFKE